MRWLGVLVALTLSGCDTDKPAPAPPSSATQSAARPTPSRRPPEPPPRRPPPQIACRALTVKGKVTAPGAPHPLVNGAPLDGLTWLELAPGAKLALRHTKSARELELSGPALVLPCAGGEEEVLLTRGSVKTSPGPGARPGAEVLIASPFGAFRYGNAQLEVQVNATSAKVKAISGEAWVELAKGARRVGPEHLQSSKDSVTLSGKPEADKLVDACRSAADVAAKRARELLGGGPAGDGGADGGTLGERARAHVEARQAARWACAVASAAVRRAESSPERDRQEMLIRRAESLWKAVPRREPATPR